MSSKAKKLILPAFSCLIFLLAILQIALSLGKILSQHPLIDFLVYYQASGNFLSGQNPYLSAYPPSSNAIGLNYPPASLLIFSLFHIFPFSISQTLFLILSFIAFIASFLLLFKMSKPNIKPAYFILLLAFLIQTFPFKFTLVLGQINAIALFLVILSLYLLSENHKPLSAFFMALGGSLKLYPLGLLPLFIIKKEIKYTLFSLVFFLFLNLYNPRFFADYFYSILPNLASVDNTRNFYDQSIFALTLRLTDNILFSKFTSAITTVILYLAITFSRRFTNIYQRIIALLALLSISGPFSWQHHLIMAYPFIFLNYYKPQYFFPIWALLAFHFQSPTNPLLQNPFLVSYQTILILFLLFLRIFKPPNLKLNTSV